ncbi:methyltransferase [Tsuneonella sp. HG222]
MQQPIGRNLDDPDILFNWLHSVAIGLPMLHFACRSGLAEAVAAGPVDPAEFARASGLPADSIRRIGNYLAAHELLEVEPGGHLIANSRTARIAELRGLWQQMINTTAAGASLLDGLSAGTNGFEARFGQPVFEYFADHPELGAQFGSFMSFMTARTLDFLRGNYAFAPFSVAIDVGGSQGSLLEYVLADRPEARGILFDLPEVAARAQGRFAGTRIEAIGGSFFEAVPPGDLYLLKQILHDWSDEESVAILSSIRAAIAPGGAVVVIDHLLGESPEPGEALSTDIAMMVWATGHERTLAQFAQLFGRAGFRMGRAIRNPRGHSVIEALPI